MVCFLWGSEQWKVALRLLTLQSLLALDIRRAHASLPLLFPTLARLAAK